MAVAFEPWRPEVLADPYPVYRRLREEDPLHWSEGLRAWIVTRYADVQGMLHDRRLSAERTAPMFERMPGELRASVDDLRRILGSFMAFTDPPRHTRLRALVARAFTPRAIAELEDRIRGVVHRLLDDAGPELDAVDAFAVPLPVLVIGELLGLDPAERVRFKRWSHDLAALIGGGLQTDGKLARALAAVRELIAYFEPILTERRARPRGGDLVDALLAAEEADERLTIDEVLGTMILLLLAGHETTTGLLGSGLWLLATHPRELARLRGSPELVPSAVEEMLRYESPTQNQGRIALERIELAGCTIEPGQLVHCTIGAANRDPAQFPDPERFDVARDPNRHLTFGHGRHFCIGAPLARLEARIALEAILARYSNIELAGPAPTWLPSVTFRALAALPLRMSS
jgi:cytochrome P450